MILAHYESISTNSLPTPVHQPCQQESARKWFSGSACWKENRMLQINENFDSNLSISANPIRAPAKHWLHWCPTGWLWHKNNHSVLISARERYNSLQGRLHSLWCQSIPNLYAPLLLELHKEKQRGNISNVKFTVKQKGRLPSMCNSQQHCL